MPVGRSKRAPEEPLPGITHGSSGYSHHRCRCQICRDANAEAARRYRAKQRRPIPEHAHGSIYGYSHYGCRCDRCKRAQADRHYKNVILPRLKKKLGKTKVPFRLTGPMEELIAEASRAFLEDSGYMVQIGKASAKEAKKKAKDSE